MNRFPLLCLFAFTIMAGVLSSCTQQCVQYPTENTCKCDKFDGYTAIKYSIGFFSVLTGIAHDTGNNCTKMGLDMMKYLNNNLDNIKDALTVISQIKINSAVGAATLTDRHYLKKLMDSDSELFSALTKCNDNQRVQEFGAALLILNMIVEKESKGE